MRDEHVVEEEECAGGERGEGVDVGDQRGAGGGVQDGAGGEVGGEVEAGWLEEGVEGSPGRGVRVCRDVCWREIVEGGLALWVGRRWGKEVKSDHEVAAVEVGWGAGEGERDGDVVGLAVGEALEGGDAEWVGADAV
jgi:hypothetical protein